MEVESHDLGFEFGTFIAEAGAAHAFVQQVRHIDIGDDGLRIKVEALGLTEDGAIFRDEAMTGVNDIRARLACACTGIHIGCETAGGLLRDE